MASSIYFATIPFTRAWDGSLLDAEALELGSYHAATVQARAAVGAMLGSEMIVGAIAVSRVRDDDEDGELTLVLTRFGETPVALIC